MIRLRTEQYLFLVLAVVGIALLLGLFFLPDHHEADAAGSYIAPGVSSTFDNPA